MTNEWGQFNTSFRATVNSWLEDRFGFLLALLIVALIVVLVMGIVYDSKHCLKHERHGYIYMWHQVGNSGYMMPVENIVCVKWDSDTTQTTVEGKDDRDY
jgi:hypothetical protein